MDFARKKKKIFVCLGDQADVKNLKFEKKNEILTICQIIWRLKAI